MLTIDTHTHTQTQKACAHTSTHYSHSTRCRHKDPLHFKFHVLSLAHTNTLFFVLPPLELMTEYGLCSLCFERVLGSWAAGALGTDMNKWTVLLSSTRRAAKHPKQEISHPLSKDLFKKGIWLQPWRVWSFTYTQPCPSLCVFAQACCECMHRYTSVPMTNRLRRNTEKRSVRTGNKYLIQTMLCCMPRNGYITRTILWEAVGDTILGF